MDDISLIFYIILGILYLLSRVFKKKEQEPPLRGPEEDMERDFGPDTSTERRRPTTFEDLLREFTGQPSQEEQDFPQAPEKTEDDEQRREAIEEVDDEVKRVYDKSIRSAENLKTIDELVNIEEEPPKIERRIEEKRKKSSTPSNKYARLLKEKNDLKTAFVLKELLDRKYD